MPPYAVAGSLIVGVLGACLALGSGVQAAAKSLQLWQRARRERNRIEDELQFLTDKERKIIAYLLAHNQRMFKVPPDGEEAATLMAKGFVRIAPRHPPIVHRDIVVEIPRPVWDLLTRRSREFPHVPARDGDGHPWRTHWMAR